MEDWLYLACAYPKILQQNWYWNSVPNIFYNLEIIRTQSLINKTLIFFRIQ